MIKIIVTGSKGRMGRRIAAMAKASADLRVVAEIDAGDALGSIIDQGDVIVDFTVAAAAAANAGIAARSGKPIVIGTTGLDADERRCVEEAARTIPIVFTPNMSVGVNVLFTLVKEAARTLGAGYAVDIVETHHVHKLDRPSGTAKKMQEIVVAAGGRAPDEVPVQSIREGEVVGDHAIVFASAEERLSIAHHAETRDVFARGALVAARWIVGKPAGLYGMDDVLGLK